MASFQPPALTAGDRTLLFLLLLVTARFSSAQSPPSSSKNSNDNPYLSNPNFNPSMAIVIVVLISAFFFLGFFSIYIRQCAGDRGGSDASTARNRAATARSRRQRGLDPAILATFPTLVYSDVRDHKLGKGSLECAVCLSEFDDDETLRLLPRCDHVFHPDCIDAWLAAHVTCPVCRCNLEETSADPQPEIAQIDPNPPTQEPEPAQTEPEPEPQQVAIQVDPTEEEEERKTEMENLEKFVNMKRARSRARPARFPRSHSTGHSLVMPGENLDRFTLRLPTNIRKEIVERAEMMQRAKSLAVYPTEGSSRRGGGGGGGGKSIQLGRSDRWGSFLMRTLSTKMTNWGRRGDGDGSSSIKGGFFRRGDSIKGDGSTKGGSVKFNAFDCYGGAATKSEESQSSAFNRV